MALRGEDTGKAIEEILRLRRAERAADPSLRGELRSVREFLETIAGPTISRAEASRLLGISQTALDRWIRSGDVASVVTPHGRREIPLTEIVELLEDVERARADGVRRPLAAVIRDRRRRSSQTIDLDRLLPRQRPRTHRIPELQSLAYHRLVGERLNEEIVDEARRRLRRQRESGRLDPRWATEWEGILELPVERIAEAIGADSSRARELRQTSPFVGVLNEQERRRLLHAIEERW
jgi:hypothetical protein